MNTPIKFGENLSTNPEVRKIQVQRIIKNLRDTYQAQKFGNEIFYTFSHLKQSIEYWKKELKRINKTLERLYLDNNKDLFDI